MGRRGGPQRRRFDHTAPMRNARDKRAIAGPAPITRPDRGSGPFPIIPVSGHIVLFSSRPIGEPPDW